jgi:hypothetical protein
LSKQRQLMLPNEDVCINKHKINLGVDGLCPNALPKLCRMS